MKHLTLIICALMAFAMHAQTPNKMTYQAVVRDGSNNLLTNTNLGIQVSILQTSPTGTIVYQETHGQPTDDNALFSIEIGDGTVASGDIDTINWAQGPYFAQVDIDPAGGSSYQITSTAELLTVPYAFHAKTAESAVGQFILKLVENNAIHSSIGEVQGATVIWAQSFSDDSGNEIKSVYVPEEKKLTLDELKKRETLVPQDDPRHIELKRLKDGGADDETAYEIAFGNNSSVIGTRTGMDENKVETKATGIFTTSVVDPNGTTSTEPMRIIWEPDQKTKVHENEQESVFIVTDPYAHIYDDQNNQVVQIFDPAQRLFIFESPGGNANVNVAGNLDVTGTLSKGAGAFKIDHPLDPYNKYLVHSFVESPDMMNVYNGNITTNSDGMATVELPSYFEALNKDFRYQLTCIGEFAQAIIKEKVTNNSFTIQTDLPHVEVSWQITGIRKDRYADENRLIVESEKEPKNKGQLLYPTKKAN